MHWGRKEGRKEGKHNLSYKSLHNTLATHRVPEEVLRHLPPLKQVSGVQGRARAGVVVTVAAAPEAEQPQELRTTTRGPTTAEELASTIVKSLVKPTQQPPTHLSSATMSGMGAAPSRHETMPMSRILTPSNALSCGKEGNVMGHVCNMLMPGQYSTDIEMSAEFHGWSWYHDFI